MVGAATMLKEQRMLIHTTNPTIKSGKLWQASTTTPSSPRKWCTRSWKQVASWKTICALHLLWYAFFFFLCIDCCCHGHALTQCSCADSMFIVQCSLLFPLLLLFCCCSSPLCPVILPSSYPNIWNPSLPIRWCCGRCKVLWPFLTGPLLPQLQTLVFR